MKVSEIFYELIRLVEKIAMLITLYPLRAFPIKPDRVVLCNSLSYKYADSPKSISEYLLNNDKNRYEIIYPVNYPEKYGELIKENVKVIKKNSILYYYYVMTASVFLTNSGGISYIPFRKGQYIINVWHGTAYKRIGMDVDYIPPLYKYERLLAAKKTDLFISTCTQFTNNIVSSAFISPKCIWEIGLPRNDMLIHRNDKKILELREQMGLRGGGRSPLCSYV